jgi:4-azaleucine resistance transporter AzlC
MVSRHIGAFGTGFKGKPGKIATPVTDLERSEFRAGLRAAIPVLLGVFPFGLVTGVAMAAGGIPPLEAILMSVVVFAGASQLAATQLLGAAAPAAVILVTVFFINLRFVMYSASMRVHLAGLPLRWRLGLGYILSDNSYALCITRYSQHTEAAGKHWYCLGVSFPIWLVWQVATILGVIAGASVPHAWKLEFAAPLAFVALSVPLLRDRAMVAAALAAGITVVLAHPLPLRLGLVLAAVAGICAGMLVEKRRPA